MFLIFLLLCRLRDTPLLTHPLTADGMKPLAALKAVRPQGPLPAPACGTPHQATHLLALQPLAGTHLDMPHLATEEPQVVCGRTAGTRPQKQKEKLLDTGVAGLKPHAQTEETNQWVRHQPRGPVRESLGGMKPQPVRWDPQHHYLLLEKLQLEHQP